jgi:hypothetical protein
VTPFNCVFRHELYVGMKYQKLADRFYAFEVDGGLIGISFVDAGIVVV